MSTKTSAQAGRRTPLSLSGAVAKSQSNKASTNIANGGGNNSNGHTTSNSNKQDNKLHQQKNDQPAVSTADSKENPSKKQNPQTDKKQQQNENKKSNEKNLNGVNNNKQESGENKQQQQNKEKTGELSGNDNNNGNEKDKKGKSENIDKLDKPKEKIEKDDTKSKEDKKVEKVNEKDKKGKSENIDKLDKPKEKIEKDDAKSKEDKKVEQSLPNNKKEEKKGKDLKEPKEDKKEESTKNDAKTEQQQPTKADDKKLKDEGHVEIADKKPQAKIANPEITQDQLQEKSVATTPKSNNKANKTSTPVSRTPTKKIEKTPQKSPQTSVAKTTPIVKREVTTTVDDEDTEMEPLAIEGSPIKPSQPEEVTNIKITPSATSTPGKIVLPKRNSAAPKSDVQLAMHSEISPERPKIFSQISGRRSIRPISEYTPSKFQSNLQFRESYRRINTELDVTNTSMNVTVGSEVPSNLSFSFFGRGRKRDRTPPQNSQLAIGELQTDMEISPPKKARLDIQGIFSAVSSPLSLLRNRFSKASLQSSTPVKLVQKLNAVEDEVEVQNVSGVSVHEELATAESTETSKTINEVSLGKEVKINTEDVTKPKVDSEEKNVTEISFENTSGMEQTFEQSDIKITETELPCIAGETAVKNKRCAVM